MLLCPNTAVPSRGKGPKRCRCGGHRTHVRAMQSRELLFTTDFLSSSSLLGCEFGYSIRCNGSSAIGIFYGRHFIIVFESNLIGIRHARKNIEMGNGQCSMSLQIFVCIWFWIIYSVRPWPRAKPTDKFFYSYLFALEICRTSARYECGILIALSNIDRTKRRLNHFLSISPYLLRVYIDDAFPSAIQRLPSAFHAFNFHWQWTGIKFASKSEKIWNQFQFVQLFNKIYMFCCWALLGACLGASARVSILLCWKFVTFDVVRNERPAATINRKAHSLTIRYNDKLATWSETAEHTQHTYAEWQSNHQSMGVLCAWDFIQIQDEMVFGGWLWVSAREGTGWMDRYESCTTVTGDVKVEIISNAIHTYAYRFDDSRRHTSDNFFPLSSALWQAAGSYDENVCACIRMRRTQTRACLAFAFDGW